MSPSQNDAQQLIQQPQTKQKTQPKTQQMLHWFSQIRAILAMDLRKSFFKRRGVLVYLLAIAPALLILGHAIFDPNRHINSAAHVQEDSVIMAAIVQIYYIRLGVFFGCMGIFTWLLRGEIVEKTLHYYFLTPVRREVLAVGKFLSGLIASATIFGGGLVLCFALMYGHIGAAGRAYVFDGPGMSLLASYLLATVMACLGYGSVFFALSLIFRNPIVPAALLMGWEAIGNILPSFLQKLTISYYLKQIAPLDLAQTGLSSLFTVVAQPIPKAVAVLGLCLLSAVVVALACRGTRRMQISYSMD